MVNGDGEPPHSASAFGGHQESQEQPDAELSRLSAAPISRGAECMPLERAPGEWSVLLIYEIQIQLNFCVTHLVCFNPGSREMYMRGE